MPIPRDRDVIGERTCGDAAATVSLPVLGAHRSIKHSRMGRRRALVLFGVHVLMAVHILHWLVYGLTLSPVEPSESMFTINLGKVNTGFVFFVLAILSTLVFGRFFCGWGCHIVALQDLCGWMMKKLGVRPRPLRSRLLVWVPLILAVYMFAWPTIRREVIRPVLGPTAWSAVAPYIGEAGERPEITAAFLTEHFWETFPPWYVAVPFILLCTFGSVYFLGAKGFCTYGCPYGGAFGPADLVAPGKIRVTDACEHCGHCTAVCTSNVRVHEEVRDYGMVVDPGCMKCMDCVSVCPNDALYFGFGRPTVAAKPRTSQPAKFKSRVYDFTRREELAYGAVFLLMVIGFRGMLELVPLLMAVGMAGIGTFLVWKLVSMLRLPNVRIQNLQLKLKGRVHPAGFATAAGAIAMLAAAVWGSAVNASLWWGGALDSRIPTPLSEVLNPAFTPTESDKTIARRALAHLERAAPFADGGLGWDTSVERTLRVARLRGILGDRVGAEKALRTGLDRSPRATAIEDPLVVLLSGTAATAAELEGSLRALLARHEGLTTVSLRLAMLAAQAGRKDEAVALAERSMVGAPDRNVGVAVGLLVQMEAPDKALAGIEKAIGDSPRSATLRETRGLLLAGMGQVEAGIEELKRAATLDPKNPSPMEHLSALLRELGRESEASDWASRAKEVRQGSDKRAR